MSFMKKYLSVGVLACCLAITSCAKNNAQQDITKHREAEQGNDKAKSNLGWISPLDTN